MRYIIEAITIALIIAALCTPVKGEQIRSTNQVYGVPTIRPMPWWVETLASVKIHGGFRIGDIWRRPETTQNVSVRTSIKTTDNTRLKFKTGDDSHVEGIYYMRENREYYIKQTPDSSMLGWRIRW